MAQGDLWLLSSPYGKRGFFYRAWIEDSTHWERFRIPATECPRISGGERYFNQEPLGAMEVDG